jgi:hypothetical protein
MTLSTLTTEQITRGVQVRSQFRRLRRRSPRPPTHGVHRPAGTGVVNERQSHVPEVHAVLPTARTG